jgi:hypothetical protein
MFLFTKAACLQILFLSSGGKFGKREKVAAGSDSENVESFGRA